MMANPFAAARLPWKGWPQIGQPEFAGDLGWVDVSHPITESLKRSAPPPTYRDAVSLEPACNVHPWASRGQYQEALRQATCLLRRVTMYSTRAEPSG